MKVGRPKETTFTPRAAQIARELIEAGKSTTVIFRALGYRSPNRLYAWLKDEPRLAELLKENAKRCQAAQGKRRRVL
jgi:hypothetical protein